MKIIRSLTAQSWAAVLWQTLFVTIGAWVFTTVVIVLDPFGTLPPLPSGGYLVGGLMTFVLVAPPTIFVLIQYQALKIAHAELRLMASTDSLTSVLGRGAFTEKVSHQLAKPGTGLAALQAALLVVDADHFKLINDTFGHDEGDTALKLIADAIRTAIRRDDVVGRIGGDEFCVFLLDADLKSATAVAGRIRELVQDSSFTPEGELHRLSVSIGCACFEGTRELISMFREADKLLYQAKEAGRNRVVIKRLPA